MAGSQTATIHIPGSRIVPCSSANKRLDQDIWACPHTNENSNRVSAFAIDANLRVAHVVGNTIQHEKFPGIHTAFGNPYGKDTGAP